MLPCICSAMIKSVTKLGGNIQGSPVRVVNKDIFSEERQGWYRIVPIAS